MEDAILTYPLTFVYFMSLFPSFVSLFRNTGKKWRKPAQNTEMKNGITGTHAGPHASRMRPLASAFQMQISFAVRKSATLKNLVRHAQVPEQNTMTVGMHGLDAANSNAPNPHMAWRAQLPLKRRLKIHQTQWPSLKLRRDSGGIEVGKALLYSNNFSRYEIVYVIF